MTTLRDCPSWMVLREMESRGYRIRVVHGCDEGDRSAIPAIPLGAASLPELISAMSARGMDLSDDEPPAPTFGDES